MTPTRSAHLSCRKEPLRNLTDHRVCRVEDVAYIILDALAKQYARTNRVEPVVALQPVHHLGCRVLERRIERARVANRKDVCGILATRPANALTFAELDLKLYLHRDLNTRADDLAVTLQRMTIAEMEQCTIHKDREV